MTPTNNECKYKLEKIAMRESEFNSIQKENKSILALGIHSLQRDKTEENELIYRTKIFRGFKRIIERYDVLNLDIIIELESFLRINADTVRSSSLCYTSTPNMDVTMLLCDVAEKITHYYASKGIQKSKLQILMPHLSEIDSKHYHYPDPHKIDLKTVLQTHVLIKEGRYLLPISYFINNLNRINSYALWQDDKNTYINPYINEWTADKNNQYLDRCDIERLKRHSDITYILAEIRHDSHLNSNKKLNLLSKINTLINVIKHVDTSLMRKEPKEWLNIIICAAFSFYRYYKMLSDDTKNNIDKDLREDLDHLLGIFLSLHRYLEKNETVDSIFLNLDKLNMKFPAPIRNGIYETIVHIQRSFTDPFREIKSSLERISITKDHDLRAYGTFLADYEQKLTKILKQKIENEEYTGSDKHFLTSDILSEFQLTIPMEEECDIETLSRIDTKTLELFFKYDNTLTDRIARNIALSFYLLMYSANGKIENWNIILKKMNSNIVSLFDTGTLISGYENSNYTDQNGAELFPTNYTAQDRAKLFTNWLNIVEHERAKMICSALKPVLMNIICTSELFNLVLKALDETRRDILYNQMKEDLGTFIESGKDLGRLLEHLTDTQKNELYNEHRDNPKLIQSIESFRDTLKFLPGDQKQNFFDNVKENISNQILSNQSTHYAEHKISIAMEQLSESQQEALLLEVRNQIKSPTKTDSKHTEKVENQLFVDINDLDKIVNSTHASKQELLTDVFRPYILNIANNLNDYDQIRKINKYLNEDDIKSLHTKYINTKLKTISHHEFETEAQKLDNNDRKVLYDSLLSKLASSEFTIVFETIKKSNRLSKNSLRTIKPEMKHYEYNQAIKIINDFFCKISANPNSVEAHAWEIYKKHHENINTNNYELMKAIHESSLKVSFMGITHATNENLIFNNAPTNTRRDKIFKSIKTWEKLNEDQSNQMKHYTENSLKHDALATAKFNSTSNTILNARKNKKIDSPMVNEETSSHNELQFR